MYLRLLADDGLLLVDLLTALVSGAVATFVPLYLGIFVPEILRWLGKGLHMFDLDLASERVQLLFAAIAAGLLVWFLVDVLGDAALLGVNQGFRSGQNYLSHIVLAGMFALGLLFLFWLEKSLISQPGLEDSATPERGQAFTIRHLGYAVALAAALGIGFHAFGEGIDIGSKIPPATTILDAIGGISAGTAYVLHKLFEGFVVGVFAVLARSATGKRLGVLGLLSGIPTILGFFVGLPGIVDTTYFFALGAAGGVYAELRLIPVFSGRDIKYGLIIAFLIGMYAMYTAGLFHG